MKIGATQLTVFAAILGIGVGPQSLAGGDKKTYNNPGGDPREETLLPPYANEVGGRMSLFCAQDEKLVVTTVDRSAVEVTCIPTGD